MSRKIYFGTIIVFLTGAFLFTIGQFFLKPERLVIRSPFIKNKEVLIEPLSINSIFNENHDWTATLSADKTIVLIATGDVIPARSVNFKTVQKNNFQWSFEKTSDFLKSADLTLINLESPFVPNCPITNTGMIFCGDQRHLQGLLFAGVDVANLANNHSGNYGKEGVESTIQLLKKSGILATGVSQPVFKEIKQTKFTFLGYTDLECAGKEIACVIEENIVKEITKAKKNADIVVVSFHWGEEYTSMPSQRQRSLAHLAIDSGADLIIGNHPHWIQPVEIYKDKFITYAHGNFIFDQMWSQKTEEGVVGKYIFYNKKLIDVEFFPVFIEDYGQPRFYEAKDKERILSEMQKTSLENSLKN